jgi:arginine/lysine/ornithine decarboxylase
VPGHGEKPGRKREQAIVALLAHPTLTRAAAAVGVSARTLRNWLKEAAFVAEYRAARRQALDLAVGQLQAAAGEAVAVLVDCLRDQGDKLRAAVAILNFVDAAKWDERDALRKLHEEMLEVREKLRQRQAPP